MDLLCKGSTGPLVGLHDGVGGVGFAHYARKVQDFYKGSGIVHFLDSEFCEVLEDHRAQTRLCCSLQTSNVHIIGDVGEFTLWVL